MVGKSDSINPYILHFYGSNYYKELVGPYLQIEKLKEIILKAEADRNLDKLMLQQNDRGKNFIEVLSEQENEEVYAHIIGEWWAKRDTTNPISS